METNERNEIERNYLMERYEHLAEAFGIYSRMWDMIHMNFSPSMFCEANRASLIGEYLVWKDFVEQAKKYNVPYFYGINEFLEEYKTAVESCLKI